jgi:tryptophan-rich sensory protein
MTSKLINVALFAIMVFTNYLANALPINGRTTGQVSDSYANLFTPAGLTFSIWGVIYLLVLVFVVIQFRESNNEIIKQISLAFSLSCAFNALWIFAWHYDKLFLSFLIMIGLLAALAVVNYKISTFSSPTIKATFGIYLGWICIATIANATVLLVSYSWDGWGISPQIWTIGIIVVGALIISFSVFYLNNYFIALAAIWAFSGIIVKQYNQNPSIVAGAIVAISIVALVTIWHLTKKQLTVA